MEEINKEEENKHSFDDVLIKKYLLEENKRVQGQITNQRITTG